jgi:hypothetical protein
MCIGCTPTPFLFVLENDDVDDATTMMVIWIFSLVMMMAAGKETKDESIASLRMVLLARAS